MTLKNAILRTGVVGDGYTYRKEVTVKTLIKEKYRCIVYVDGLKVEYGEEEKFVTIQAEWHPGFETFLPVDSFGNYAKRIHLINDKIDGKVNVRYWYNSCRRKCCDLFPEKTTEPQIVQFWLDEGEPVVMVCQNKIFKHEYTVFAINEDIIVTPDGVYTYTMPQK